MKMASFLEEKHYAEELNKQKSGWKCNANPKWEVCPIEIVLFIWSNTFF